MDIVFVDLFLYYFFDVHGICSDVLNLIFDISLPNCFVGQEKQIQNRIEEALTLKENNTIYTVITFDPIAFNQRDE